VSTPLVVQQIEAVLGDIGADAIKIGMLANAEIVSAVARTLASRASLPMVIDPVMIAKGGDRLLETSAVAILRSELLALADVATPNIPEAEVLAEMPIRSLEDMRLAGERIRRLGPRIVLVKGGHAEGSEAIDVAVMEAGTVEIRGPRLPGRHTHGTGCTLSSAIASNLAKGMAAEAAIRAAREFLEGAIRHAPQIGAGHGPLNHAWRHEPGGYTG
jgi:hydroxymethylpyrimidine/phosphomethylpyrimidine kinase